MAGKGFNKEVEEQYAVENVDLNFQAVDKMEQQVVSENELRRFVEQGRLGEWEEQS